MLKNNLIFNLCDFISVSDPTLTIQKNISQEMKVVVVSMGNPCVYSLVLKTLNVFESEGNENGGTSRNSGPKKQRIKCLNTSDI